MAQPTELSIVTKEPERDTRPLSPLEALLNQMCNEMASVAVYSGRALQALQSKDSAKALRCLAKVKKNWQQAEDKLAVVTFSLNMDVSAQANKALPAPVDSSPAGSGAEEHEADENEEADEPAAAAAG